MDEFFYGKFKEDMKNVICIKDSKFWRKGEKLEAYESSSYDVYIFRDSKLILILDQVTFALFFTWEAS